MANQSKHWPNVVHVFLVGAPWPRQQRALNKHTFGLLEVQPCVRHRVPKHTSTINCDMQRIPQFGPSYGHLFKRRSRRTLVFDQLPANKGQLHTNRVCIEHPMGIQCVWCKFLKSNARNTANSMSSRTMDRTTSGTACAIRTRRLRIDNKLHARHKSTKALPPTHARTDPPTNACECGLQCNKAGKLDSGIPNKSGGQMQLNQ